jgi:hypothetical protein
LTISLLIRKPSKPSLFAKDNQTWHKLTQKGSSRHQPAQAGETCSKLRAALAEQANEAHMEKLREGWKGGTELVGVGVRARRRGQKTTTPQNTSYGCATTTLWHTHSTQPEHINV